MSRIFYNLLSITYGSPTQHKHKLNTSVIFLLLPGLSPHSPTPSLPVSILSMYCGVIGSEMDAEVQPEGLASYNPANSFSYDLMEGKRARDYACVRAALPK